MCTLTFLPTGKDSFLFTHNRDEKFTRKIAQHPERRPVGEQEALYPIDSDAGGTWIATSKLFTCGLLNGGKTKHVSSPPYKKSRGSVIPEFLQMGSVDAFLSSYSFSDMEPFTLIILDHIQHALHEIIHNENGEEHTERSYQESHIWSSVTLYDETDRQRRAACFDQFVLECNYQREQIISFHKDGFMPKLTGEGFIIHREGQVHTVSITSIEKAEKISMHYLDLIQHEATREEL
jgi:uncharacterized protein with NRDE domain